MNNLKNVYNVKNVLIVMNVQIVSNVKIHKLLLIVLMLAKVINANIVSLVHQILIQYIVMIAKNVKVVMFVENSLSHNVIKDSAAIY